MSTTPLILKGNLKIGADAGSAADVSDAIFKFRLKATAAEVTIPATLATPETSRKGAVKYEIEIDFLSNDTASTELFRVLWAAINTADGTLYFEGNLRDGATSATNPKWSGNFIVLGAGIGAEAESLSQDSQTYPLTGAPTMATS